MSKRASDPDPLTAGEAHVALVLTDAAPVGQTGWPIGPVAFAAYSRHNGAADAWVGLAPALAHTPVGRLDRRFAGRHARVHVFGSMPLHHAAVRAGLGQGLMPCALGDRDPDLVRASEPVTDPKLTLWVLLRSELRAAARAAAFARHLRAGLTAHRALINGRLDREAGRN